MKYEKSIFLIILLATGQLSGISQSIFIEAESFEINYKKTKL
jgi:hypothetical protein